MAKNNNGQAIEKIATTVIESQRKIILGSQCLKAQDNLLGKLKKQSEHQKEICNNISSGNLKLKSEIEIAEQEIKSLNLGIEIIKRGQIELKKEYLLCKEKKAEICNRIIAGKNKYEKLWSTAKNSYESIPCVQQLIQVENKSRSTQANINNFVNEYKNLIIELKTKKNELMNKDKARVIDIAKFFVHIKPEILQLIIEKNTKIIQVSKEIEMFINKKRNKSISKIDKSLTKYNTLQIVTNVVRDNHPSKKVDKDTFELSNLHLLLRTKLDEIKKMTTHNIAPIKRAGISDFEESSQKKQKTEENFVKSYISPYFNTDMNVNHHNGITIESKVYSDQKQINILEDIRIDKNDAYKLIKNLERNQLQETNYIGSKYIHQSDQSVNSQEKRNSVEIEEIEEIDLSVKKNEVNIVLPPSQFLDISQKTFIRKSVKFDIPNEDKVILIEENPQEIENSKSPEKSLNTSITNEESYAEFKDMILKKHKLDLSPQFVYGKNKQLQMQLENKVTTSDFFKKQDDIRFDKDDQGDTEKIETQDYNENLEETKPDVYVQENSMANSSPKLKSNDSEAPVTGTQVPVAGLLFKHGPQGIPDSLNVSISTTGFDESEDFPHCIDSSVLLSPTADLPANTSNFGNNEVTSVKVPNFLQGFRKTGLSFFGCTSDQIPDSSEENRRVGFNFNFGKDDKKGRGGLISMFR